ncbi:Linear gramicidin synthase subunit B [Streptomyces sp. YIM 130001]|uniref:amino acid adenylation domain-containing protein n=1 Tax=Streptomyces sp. YIM 130001 TaxID=2259644 RepID=UPI000E657C9E|nr:amino acid adenylation domain-containing protein [Streptomyces sp. YIM 130001]RII13406.1 Linear gramicidin synthase subunit B [Streptomyces sp. YIM 130001]
MDRLTGDDVALAVHRRINRTAAPYPDDRGVKELFEEVAARLPEATALVHRDRVITYRDLNRAANGIAARLQRRGVAAGAAVVIGVARSPELIAAILGVLKCGGHYVPVDLAWPTERLRSVLTQTGAAHLVTDVPEAVAGRFPGLDVLSPDAPPVEADPVLRTRPDDLAYVNFTSGSTGRPKGVPIRHRSIARLVFNAPYARLGERSRILQLAPVYFDAATFEIWGALLHGGTCVLYPSQRIRLSELRRTVASHGVTVIFLTTALFNTVVDEGPAALDQAETVLTGGELHSMRHLRTAVARYGPGKVVNVYGPTECTTFATYHPLELSRLPESVGDLPIGRPLQNTRLYVVDGDALCPPGRVGEICLAGPGLSPGYLDARDADRGHFVDREIGGVPERLYRTGDRGRLLPDGEVVFEGRLDDQVKINGFRIELSEVAHHLDLHPGVRLSHVVVGENGAGDKALTAFVVPHEERCTAREITDFLGDHLPGYMIPTAIHFRDSLPLSGNGKVDRRALLTEHAMGGAR